MVLGWLMAKAKRQKLLHSSTDAVAQPPQDLSGTTDLLSAVTWNDLSVDEHAIILGYLTQEEIMCARVCKILRKAASLTIVSPTNYIIDSGRKYNALAVMMRALPKLNLHDIELNSLGSLSGPITNSVRGDGPNEDEIIRTSNYTSHDIALLSNCTKLRILKISESQLNGRYPSLFNFPLLQELSIHDYDGLFILDLEMLTGLRALRKLHLSGVYSYKRNNSIPHNIGGNISSLRALKDTLEEVSISTYFTIEGNFMEFADFPHLKRLYLMATYVTGDVRDITENDFPKLKELGLPSRVYGGCWHRFERIADVNDSDLMDVFYLLHQRSISVESYITWSLSEESPDWYERHDNTKPPPPFDIQLVQAGPRFGWRWTDEDDDGNSCEINWLDPEPERGTCGYEAYANYIQHPDETIAVTFYKGFHQPPTEEEYIRLCSEYVDDSSYRDEDSSSDSDDSSLTSDESE